MTILSIRSCLAALLLSWSFVAANALENYCPGDEDLFIPSHSPHSTWPGWKCRRHSMAYKGTLESLETVDFKAIDQANKTILYAVFTSRLLTTKPRVSPYFIHQQAASADKSRNSRHSTQYIPSITGPETAGFTSQCHPAATAYI